MTLGVVAAAALAVAGALWLARSTRRGGAERRASGAAGGSPAAGRRCVLCNSLLPADDAHAGHDDLAGWMPPHGDATPRSSSAETRQ